MDRSSRSSPSASSLPQGGARCHEHSEARIVSHCLCRHLALAESPSTGVTQPAVSHARLWLGVITVTPPARLRVAGESRPLPPPCSALSRGSAGVPVPQRGLEHSPPSQQDPPGARQSAGSAPLLRPGAAGAAGAPAAGGAGTARIGSARGPGDSYRAQSREGWGKHTFNQF